MPATLEQARAEVTTFDERQAQILRSVDHMLSVHDAWESDPKAPDVPSEALEQAILAAIETCTHGGIPAQCRHLCTTAIPRLAFEWEEYADGRSRRPDGTPVARFWAAFKAVIDARKGAQRFVYKRPEPVHELLRQGVSFEQIGRHMYGYRGEGPFLRDDMVIIELILQEAKEPGSVVPPDWIHGAELERKRQWEQAVDERLAAASARENDQTETAVDRMPIKDFLLQGADPQVIANVKGVPVDDVYKVAQKLQEQGLWPPRQPGEPEASAAKESQQASSSDAQGDDADDDEDEMFDALTFIEDNQASMGVAELIAGLKEHGVKMTAKQVQSTIARLAKAKATA